MKMNITHIIRRIFVYGLLGGVLLLSPLSVYSGKVAIKSEANKPLLTAKERLSNKAADNQRVNNCKVPLEKRGAEIRPDGCKKLLVISGTQVLRLVKHLLSNK